MKRTTMKPNRSSALSRRNFLTAGAALTTAGCMSANPATAQASDSDSVVTPPEGMRLLLSCKLGMIQPNTDSLVDRLSSGAEAGFDGVDLDDASKFTPQEARDAVRESGVFVHNAINHAHWSDRLTSPEADVRAKGRANIEHCIRVSHAAGGSGVLIVVGRDADGAADEINDRCRHEIKQLLPLAASLGQMILIENVWNGMHYDKDAAPEQSAAQFVEFVDSFNSPWVGMYYDIGNHWKYGQPGDWIREFGRRCVKLDVKGFSRATGKFTEIGAGDLPWDQVRKALDDISFTGWATAEVGGGNVERLTTVRKQMQQVFGLASD